LNWVVRLPSGALAGYVQATVCGDGRAFVAYELASRFWRQGIGGAAVRALLDELAARHAVHTCLAVFKARNFRSEALLRSLGFQAAAAGAAPPAECDPDERVMVKLLLAHAGDAA
jgi:RimJ/RimL family protein N-acetyltransferase